RLERRCAGLDHDEVVAEPVHLQERTAHRAAYRSKRRETHDAALPRRLRDGGGDSSERRADRDLIERARALALALASVDVAVQAGGDQLVDAVAVEGAERLALLLVEQVHGRQAHHIAVAETLFDEGLEVGVV